MKEIKPEVFVKKLKKVTIVMLVVAVSIIPIIAGTVYMIRSIKNSQNTVQIGTFWVPAAPATHKVVTHRDEDWSGPFVPILITEQFKDIVPTNGHVLIRATTSGAQGEIQYGLPTGKGLVVSRAVCLDGVNETGLFVKGMKYLGNGKMEVTYERDWFSIGMGTLFIGIMFLGSLSDVGFITLFCVVRFWIGPIVWKLVCKRSEKARSIDKVYDNIWV